MRRESDQIFVNSTNNINGGIESTNEAPGDCNGYQTGGFKQHIHSLGACNDDASASAKVRLPGVNNTKSINYWKYTSIGAHNRNRKVHAELEWKWPVSHKRKQQPTSDV